MCAAMARGFVHHLRRRGGGRQVHPGRAPGCQRLAALGGEVVTTREPGGSPGAEAIRALLVTGAADRWSPIAETLLMYAARRDHIERVILPALERGAVGGLRPLRRFHPRLSGRRGRRAGGPDRGAGEPCAGRGAARPHRDPGSAGRRGPGARRRQGRGREIASRPRAGPSTIACGRDSSPSRAPSRSAAW